MVRRPGFDGTTPLMDGFLEGLAAFCTYAWRIDAELAAVTHASAGPADRQRPLLAEKPPGPSVQQWQESIAPDVKGHHAARHPTVCELLPIGRGRQVRIIEVDSDHISEPLVELAPSVFGGHGRRLRGERAHYRIPDVGIAA